MGGRQWSPIVVGADNSSVASRVAASAAATWVSERLGYTSVEVRIAQNATAAVADVARGDSHVLPLVWSDAVVASWGLGVEVLGTHGVSTGRAWHIPTALLAAHPELALSAEDAAATIDWSAVTTTVPVSLSGATLHGVSAHTTADWPAGVDGGAAAVDAALGGAGAATAYTLGALSSACDAFAAAGLAAFSCDDSSVDDAALAAAWHAAYDAGDEFVVYMDTGDPHIASRNMTRVSMCGDDGGALGEAVDVGLALLWPQARLLLPADVLSAVSALRFGAVEMAALVGHVEGEATLGALGAGESAEATPEGAACAWLRISKLGGDASVGLGAIAIYGIDPPSGPATGGVWVDLVGNGFGYIAPAQALARVGDRICADVRWVSDTLVQCLLPRGAGLKLSISLQFGSSVLELEGAFDYDPAVLRGIGVPGTDDATAFQGASITVAGEGFADTQELACKFLEIVVPATYINDTAIMCTVPLGLQGVVAVGVTNDGIRYSNGLSVKLEDIVWPGGLTRVPLDFHADSAPTTLHVTLVTPRPDRDALDMPTALFLMQHAVDEVNADPNVLPFTTVTASVVDSAEAALLSGEAQLAAATTLLQSILDDNANTVGIVVEGPSGLSLSLQAAMAQMVDASHSSEADDAVAPLAAVSASSTSPLLSDPQQHPWFARVVPSDAFQGRALAMLVRRLAAPMTMVGLWGNTRATRPIGVISNGRDVYAGQVTHAFESELATSSGVFVDWRLDLDEVTAADLGGVGDGAVSPLGVEELTQLLAPLAPGGAAEHIRVVFLATTFGTIETLLDAAGPLGIMDDSHVWLGPDGVVTEQILTTHPAAIDATFIGVLPSAGRSEATLALADLMTDATGFVDPWGSFIFDAVRVFAEGVDALVRETRSPNVTDYTDARTLMPFVRRVDLEGKGATGFTVFEPGTNDPATFNYDALLVTGGVRTWVGTIVGDDVTIEIDGEVVAVGDPRGLLPLMPRGNTPVQLEAIEWVTIGVIFSGFNTVVGGLLEGAELAVADANAAGLLGDTKLRLHVEWFSGEDDDADSDAALMQHVDDSNEKLVGFVGPSTSGVSLAVSQLFTDAQMPFVSPSAGRRVLSSAEAHPFFLRTIADEESTMASLADTVRRFAWMRVGTMAIEDGGYSQSVEAAFALAAADAGIDVAFRGLISQDALAAANGGDFSAVAAVYASAIRQRVHVFVLPVLPTELCSIIGGAEQAGAVGEAYIHVSPSWIGVVLPCAEGLDRDTILEHLTGSVGVNAAFAISESGSRLRPRLREIGLRPVDPEIVVGDSDALDVVNARRAAHAAAEGTDQEYQETWDAAQAYAAVQLYTTVAREMLELGLDVTDGQLVMSNLRELQLATAAGLIEFPDPASNDPWRAAVDIVNQLSPYRHQVVGTLTDKGFVRVEGCQPGEARDLSTFLCSPCEEGTFKSEVGDAQCTPCPSLGDNRMTTAGLRGATSVTQCQCPVNFVEPLEGRSDTSTAWPCHPCPVGGICDQTGLTWARIRNHVGYWRGNPNATFTRCATNDQCRLSGLTEPVSDAAYEAAALVGASFKWSTPCPVGTLPPLCDVCDIGYGRSFDNSCSPCPAAGETYAMVVSMALLWVTLACLLAWQQFSRAKRPSVAATRRANNMRVLINVVQYQSFLEAFDVRWTSPLRRLFELQSSVSTTASLVSTACMDPDDSPLSPAAMELVAYASLPALSLVLLIFATAVFQVMGHLWGRPRRVVRLHARAAERRRLRNRWRRLCDQGCCQGHRQSSQVRGGLVDVLRGVRGQWFDAAAWQDFSFSLFSSLLLLIYPRLVWTSLTMFDCVEVEGSSRLRGDLGVSCDSDEYLTFRAVAIAAAIVWVVGWPVAVAAVLIRKRDKLFLPDSTAAKQDQHVLVLLDDVEQLHQVVEKVQLREKWVETWDCRVGMLRKGLMRMKSLARMVKEGPARGRRLSSSKYHYRTATVPRTPGKDGVVMNYVDSPHLSHAPDRALVAARATAAMYSDTPTLSAPPGRTRTAGSAAAAKGLDGGLVQSGSIATDGSPLKAGASPSASPLTGGGGTAGAAAAKDQTRDASATAAAAVAAAGSPPVEALPGAVDDLTADAERVASGDDDLGSEGDDELADIGVSSAVGVGSSSSNTDGSSRLARRWQTNIADEALATRRVKLVGPDEMARRDTSRFDMLLSQMEGAGATALSGVTSQATMDAFTAGPGGSELVALPRIMSQHSQMSRGHGQESGSTLHSSGQLMTSAPSMAVMAGVSFGLESSGFGLGAISPQKRAAAAGAGAGAGSGSASASAPLTHHASHNSISNVGTWVDEKSGGEDGDGDAGSDSSSDRPTEQFGTNAGAKFPSRRRARVAAARSGDGSASSTPTASGMPKTGSQRSMASATSTSTSGGGTAATIEAQRALARHVFAAMKRQRIMLQAAYESLVSALYRGARESTLDVMWRRALGYAGAAAELCVSPCVALYICCCSKRGTRGRRLSALSSFRGSTMHLLDEAPAVYHPTLNEAFGHIVVTKLAEVARHQRRFGFAFVLYRPEVCTVAELTNQMRKLALIACAIYAAPLGQRVQVALGILVVLVSVGMTILMQPYAYASLYKRSPKYASRHMRVLRRALARWVAVMRMRRGDVPPVAFEPDPRSAMNTVYVKRKANAGQSVLVPQGVLQGKTTRKIEQPREWWCLRRYRMPADEVLTENWRRDVAWANVLRQKFAPLLSAADSEAARQHLLKRQRVLMAKHDGRPPRFTPLVDPPMPFAAALPEALSTSSLEVLALLVTLTNLTASLLLGSASEAVSDAAAAATASAASDAAGSSVRLSAAMASSVVGVSPDGRDAIGEVGEVVVTVVLLSVNVVVMVLFVAVIVCDLYSQFNNLESAGADKILEIGGWLANVKEKARQRVKHKVSSTSRRTRASIEMFTFAMSTRRPSRAKLEEEPGAGKAGSSPDGSGGGAASTDTSVTRDLTAVGTAPVLAAVVKGGSARSLPSTGSGAQHTSVVSPSGSGITGGFVRRDGSSSSLAPGAAALHGNGAPSAVDADGVETIG